jgi:DNA repair protein RecO (recombination protein O)
MEIQKATGIVLSSRTIGEADYLVRFFTKEYGKREFVFKGLKKSKRRSQSIAEPGTAAELVYYFHDDKNYHTVNEYSIHRHYLNIRDNLSKIFSLYFFVDAVDKTCGLNDPNKQVFGLLAAGIETLRETVYTGHLAVFFLLHLLRLLGILPDFSRCKNCGNSELSDFKIDNTDFQPVCGKCSSSLNSGYIFKNRTMDFIDKSLSKKFSAIDPRIFPEEEVLHLLFQLTLFTQNYFHIELKSKEILISELSRPRE